MGGGWHADPYGRHQHRFHDGVQWTDHVADHGIAGIDAPWGFGPALREHPDGTTVLVLGILSLVLCGLLGPVAWSKGRQALAQMDASPGVQWTNRGQVNAGRICGIVASALLGLGVGFIALAVLVGAFTSTT